MHKPPNNMPLTMHNIHFILSHLRAIEGFVILWDIKIEDIKNVNFWKGVMQYTLQQNNYENINKVRFTWIKINKA